MLTKHPWFGPKRWGWGWVPVSREGWLATFLCLAVIVGAFGGTPLAVYSSVGVLAAFIVICIVAGTPPGGSF